MNLKKILLSALVSTTLTAPLMATDPMDVAPSPANQGQGQPVIFHKADGTTIDAAQHVTNDGYLHFIGRNLKGNIPPALGSLHQLTSVGLADNNLEGNIPAELGSLYQLTSMNLSDNNLSGSIPAELGSLHQLRYLGLTHNNLSGNIPREAFRGDSLKAIHLTNNLLTGFDGRDLTSDTVIDISKNPLITFVTNPQYKYSLIVSLLDMTLINIHFDGSKMDDLANLRGVLQQNVVSYNPYIATFPLRIAFYKGKDHQNPHPISNYLQGFGVTQDTVIMKDEHGNITVERGMDELKAQTLIGLLNQVRDMPE